MPTIGKHHIHSYSNAWALKRQQPMYRTPVSGVFRRRDSGFVVCGENLASVSQFVAGIRHGRSFKQEHDEDDGAVWLQEEIRVTMRPFSAEPMRMWPISTRVNKPEGDDPSLLDPVAPASARACSTFFDCPRGGIARYSLRRKISLPPVSLTDVQILLPNRR
jgi:hypothetical protein